MHILPKLSSTVISLLSASFSGFTIVALGLFYSDVGTASNNKAILLPIESYVAMGLGALLHVIVTLLNLVITTKLVDKDMGRCLKNHSQFKIPHRVLLGIKLAVIVCAAISFGLNLDLVFTFIYTIRQINLIHMQPGTSLICLMVATIFNCLLGIASTILGLFLLFIKMDDEDQSTLSSREPLLEQ